MNTNEEIVGMVAQDNNLKTRVLTSIPLILLVLVCIYFGEYPFLMLCCFVSSLIALEAIKLLSSNGKTLLNFFSAISIFGTSLITHTGYTDPWAYIFGAVSCTIIIIFYYTMNPKIKPFKLFVFSAIILISIIFATIGPWLRNTPDGLVFVFWLCLAVWINDIASYGLGRLIGGPKLLPSISPKKTISGALGGVIFTVIFSILWFFITTRTGLINEDNNIITLAILGIVISIIAQIGDLIESAFKRKIGIKDTSNLIPGHGGIMDRMDSLVFAVLICAPAMWIIGEKPLSW